MSPAWNKMSGSWRASVSRGSGVKSWMKRRDAGGDGSCDEEGEVCDSRCTTLCTEYQLWRSVITD